MPSIQQSYSIYPDIGYVGVLARPTEPHATASGLINVPSSLARAPQPGDALWYDSSSNRFRVPETDAHLKNVCAILGYRMDTVAEADSTVKFTDGEEIQFFIHGTVWVTAGTAMEYGDRLSWDKSDSRWDVLPRPDVAIANLTGAVNLALVNSLKNSVVEAINGALDDLGRYPVTCVSRDPVAVGGLAMAQIGYGRVA